MNALRVLVNGTQAGPVFIPSAPLDRTWYKKGVVLSEYAGQQVELCFQSHTGLAPEFDPFSIGDVIFIDNIWVGDLALSTDEIAADRNQLAIFPNPADAGAQLQYDAVRTGTAQVRIMSLNGQRLLEQRWDVSAGQNTLPLNTSSLSSGVYMVQLWQDGQVFTKRFVKL
jgi:hypothetical protein